MITLQRRPERAVPPNSAHRAVTALAGLAFAVEATAVLVLGPEALLTHVNADDMYYYLVIARHLVDGAGPTFDGAAPTNGFHPLYLLLLTPLAATLSPLGLVKGALLLLLAAHNAVGVALSRGLGTRAAAATGALWILSPGPLWITLTGVEASLAALSWVLALTALDRSRTGRASPVLVGLLAALAVWARTDGLVLVGAIGLTELIRGRTRAAATIGVVVAGATAPWFTWNLVTFGDLMQVSGHATFAIAHGYGPISATSIASGWASTVPAGLGQILRTAGIWLVIALLAARDARVDGPRLRAALHRGDAAWLALAVDAAYYLLWQQHMQIWYFLPMSAATLVGAAYVLEITWPDLVDGARRGLAGVALVACVAAHGAFLAVGAHGYVGMDQAWPLITWVREHLPADARVGSWNAGALGFWSERQVVNLDGVVNQAAYEQAVAEGSMALERQLPYVHEVGITHLADLRELEHVHADSLGLAELAAEEHWRVLRVAPVGP